MRNYGALAADTARLLLLDTSETTQRVFACRATADRAFKLVMTKINQPNDRFSATHVLDICAAVLVLIRGKFHARKPTGFPSPEPAGCLARAPECAR